MPDILETTDAECNWTAEIQLHDKENDKYNPNHATIFFVNMSIDVFITSSACDSGALRRPFSWIFDRFRSSNHLLLQGQYWLLRRHSLRVSHRLSNWLLVKHWLRRMLVDCLWLWWLLKNAVRRSFLHFYY